MYFVKVKNEKKKQVLQRGTLINPTFVRQERTSQHNYTELRTLYHHRSKTHKSEV